MAQTSLQGSTVQEKLNKMAVDLISVTPVVSASGTDAVGELLFDSIEIPYAVNEDGGSSILQSITAFSNDDNKIINISEETDVSTSHPCHSINISPGSFVTIFLF